MGFIGSDSRLLHPLPRAAIVPGLVRSRASFWSQRNGSSATGRIHTGNDVESQPLIPAIDDGDDASRRNRHYASDRLAPDTPWDDDDDNDLDVDSFVDAVEDVHGIRRGVEESDEDAVDGGFVFVRPDFISVPPDSPRL